MTELHGVCRILIVFCPRSSVCPISPPFRQVARLERVRLLSLLTFPTALFSSGLLSAGSICCFTSEKSQGRQSRILFSFDTFKKDLESSARKKNML